MHQRVAGGCHKYAKGAGQFSCLSPGFIERGEGCHVWDIDGNEFIGHGMGSHAVTLGRVFPEVVSAAAAELQGGQFFGSSRD